MPEQPPEKAHVHPGKGGTGVLQSKIQNPKSEIDAPKSEIDAPKSEIDAPKSEIDALNPTISALGPRIDAAETEFAPESASARESAIRDPQSTIGPQSEIRNPQSKTRDPQSAGRLRADARLGSLQSKIQNPKSKIAYAELHCLSNFSFLRGASHPEELVERAGELGYAAVAITDRNSLAGVVRAHVAARVYNQEHADRPLRLIIGAEITPVDAPPIVLLTTDRASHGRLCRLITRGRLRAIKGDCIITLADVAEFADGLIGILDFGFGILDWGGAAREIGDTAGEIGRTAGERRGIEGSRDRGIKIRLSRPLSDHAGYLLRTQTADEPEVEAEAGVLVHQNPARECGDGHSTTSVVGSDRGGDSAAGHSQSEAGRLQSKIQNSKSKIEAYRAIFPKDCLYLAAALAHGEADEARLTRLVALSRETGIPLVATNRVHYHDPQRRYLQDVLTCIREKCALATAGSRLLPNAERHMRPLEEIERRYGSPADAAVRREARKALARTVAIARRCTFSLDELRYEYPHEVVPAGRTPMEYLEELTWASAARRYDTVPLDVRRLLESELALIREVGYEHYFLTVHDLVCFARSRGILCQGRGSAANSAVCYCLGITAVDPARHDLLFERFISRERNEPPDIDVDFEHERREEVFQYIYQKYGRERAAITAEVITYRPRSAVRDVGKALGLSLDRVDAIAKSIDWFSREPIPAEALRNAGLDPSDRTVQMMLRLVKQLLGFPRHLSQHVGGFVITETPLCEIVPLENGAMPDRTFIEWDKDDIDALGMLKIDCLALGMLTAIGKCFGLLNAPEGRRPQLASEGRRSKLTPEGRTPQLAPEGRTPVAGGVSPRRRDASLPNSPGGAAVHDAAPVSAAPTGLFWNRDVARRGFTPPATGVRPSGADCGARSSGGECGDRISGTDRGDRFSGTDRGAPYCGADRGLCLVAPGVDDRDYVAEFGLVPQSLTDIPPEDPVVYDMICKADTVGVFQIESRAQMSMLPRLRPRNFYDLVIEVAIVRPGPIQGGMVHPFLKRRDGIEPVTYPSPAVQKVLEKTLGVPLFQEQVMRLAVVAAGFTPGEADQLRRAMGAWRRNGEMQKFQTKLMAGLLANGYKKEFAESLYKQIAGFGEYGFPESHSASFSLLVYASAWLKCYYPAAYCAAVINSQPMGFYTPSQLIQDAVRHGVRVLPVDVGRSGFDCTLETPGDCGLRIADCGLIENCELRIADSAGANDVTDGMRAGAAGQSAIRNPQSAIIPQSAIRNPQSGPAIRLGFRLVRGLSAEKVARIAAARKEAPIDSIETLARRPDVSRDTLLRLAAADAFRSLGLSRREALWRILALENDEPPLFAGQFPAEEPAALPAEPLDETLVHDYDATGLSLNAHPMDLVRAELTALRVSRSDALGKAPRGRRISVAGLVTCRQHPSTAKGTVFLTLEDEAGNSNLIVRPNVWERYGSVGRAKTALIADGVVERQGEVVHVMVTRLRDLSANLVAVRTKSRDFR